MTEAGAPLTLRRTARWNGQTLELRLGGRSWGRLSAARDNAVLVCHYYTGTAQAAGHSAAGPGWWSGLIGPGLAVDTDRLFVVCLNTPSNVQLRGEGRETTGPDTRHPDGERWGERFPVWGFPELHALQLELLRELKLPRWHAVIGPSFGGMQALHWAARSPELAPRVAAVACAPGAGPVLRGAFGPLLRAATEGRNEDEALLAALRLISFFGLGAPGWRSTFADTDADAYLRGRAECASLAHLLDIGRVVSGHRLPGTPEELAARWRELGTRLLTVNVTGDLFFPEEEMREFHARSSAAGAAHRHLEYASAQGHLGCVGDVEPFAGALRDLLGS